MGAGEGEREIKDVFTIIPKRLLEHKVESQLLNKVKPCLLPEAGISCTQNSKLSLDKDT